MSNNETEDWQSRLLRVVVNEEEQYSIWPLDRTLPDGWRDAGRTGNKQECLAFIRAVWHDITPLSVRRRLGRP